MAQTSAAARSRFSGVKTFCRSPEAAICLAVLVVLMLLALFAPQIAWQNPHDLAQISIMDGTLPPGAESMDGNIFWLGSDDQGRDIWSALLYGLQTSLLVGVSASVIAFLIGACVGMLASYAGGRIDTVIMRIVDLQLSFPTILLALLLIAAMGKSVGNVILAIVLVEWAVYARTARAAALSEIRRDYIEAARGLMMPARRIIFRHLFPNCLPPLMVLLTMQFARAITLEATLSFLGLGTPITQPSLGMMISNGFPHVISGAYWMSFFPGAALMLLVFVVNMVGDRLRSLYNPREVH